MKKVLIVDDIEENRYMLEVLVKGYGFESVSACNGAEALGLAINELPDIVISDILMPVMDGYIFCSEWKKNEILKNIPFVFYTATYTHPKDEEFALSLGADRFLIKPQEPDFFINMINEVINDFNANKINIHKPSNLDELNTLKEYNEALIRKMEDRMLKSQKSEKKIRDYAFQLENEIEQRKQATIALKESEEKYRSIFENSGVAILLTSPVDGKVLSANDYACKMFGRTEEEICNEGRNGLVDITDPNLSILLEERTQKGHATGEVTLLKKDGSKFKAEVSSVIFYDKDNNLLTSMVMRDLTEQKEAEEAIKQSEEELNFAQEIAKMGSWILNVHTNKITCSKNFLKLIGLKEDDIELSFDFIMNKIYPDDRIIIEKHFTNILKNFKPLSFDIRIVSSDDEIKWIQNTIVPVFDKDSVCAIHGVYIDITEKKIIEQELLAAKDKAEKSNQLKTAFLNNISHEIRTPLNGILGFGNLILEQDLSEEEKKSYYNILENSSNRLIKTITDIMDISLIVSGNVIPEIAKYKIDNLVDDLYILLQESCKMKNLTSSLQIDSEIKNLCINTDFQLLKKAVTHLIDNAVKFTNQGGKVEFGVEMGINKLVFFAKDTGVGINSDALESLFDYFIQEDISDTRGYEGTGLGLTIANRLVKLLGGHIDIKSEKGVGSVFYIYLPHNQIDGIYSDDKMLKQNEKVKILVAEDDDDNYTLIETFFKKNNIEFIRAADGTEAIEIIKNFNDISLIMMDLKMPKMGGLEATEIIKSIDKSIPIIAVTAYSMLGDEYEALKSGCDDFIEKPLNISILKKKFEKFGIKI